MPRSCCQKALLLHGHISPHPVIKKPQMLCVCRRKQVTALALSLVLSGSPVVIKERANGPVWEQPSRMLRTSPSPLLLRRNQHLALRPGTNQLQFWQNREAQWLFVQMNLPFCPIPLPPPPSPSTPLLFLLFLCSSCNPLPLFSFSGLPPPSALLPPPAPRAKLKPRQQVSDYEITGNF